jgi:hypothetical protein
MTDDRKNRDKEEAREDDSIAGMGGGIAGPSEPGSAGTAGGGTAIGGETSTTSKPSSRGAQGELSGNVADAFRSASGKRREAPDELADRETGSPGGRSRGQ